MSGTSIELQGRSIDRSGDRPSLVIEPTRGLGLERIREVWPYRELLWVLIERDLRVRYKQTVLGILWAVLQPLLAMVIFTVVFGRVAKLPSDGYPYAVWVYAALLPWTFFSGCLTSASNSLVGSAQLVTKVYFPRLIIPLSSVGTNLVDFLISSLVLMALMALYGVGVTWNIVVAPLLLLLATAIAFGIGTLLGSLTVAYRDFRYVVPFLVQLWLYASPVVYPVSLFPEKWRAWLYLNPMTGVIEGFRSAFLGSPFNLQALAFSVLGALLSLTAGVLYFERVERRFADII